MALKQVECWKPMPEILSLSDLLSSIDKFSLHGALFLPQEEVWDGNSRCAVLITDDEDDPDIPPFAQQHGLSYALGMYDVFQIVENAKLQHTVDVPRLVEAFLFYYDNDAFIDFSAVEGQGHDL